MDGQITLAGLQFSATDADGTIRTVSDLVGWYDSPAMRTQFSARPYAAGSHHSPAYQEVRKVTITGRVVGPDEATFIRAKRKIGGLCIDPAALFELRVDDAAGSLSTNAQRTSEVLFKPVSAYAADYSLSVTAPDPRLFDVLTQALTTPMAQQGAGGVLWNGSAGATGGAQWNGPAGTTGLSWGQPGPSGIVTVDNTLGNAPADAVVTITGPALNPTIFTPTNTITYGGSLGASDQLVINTFTGSVLLNGVNRGSLLTRADWFQIPPYSKLQVGFAADLQNATAQMTVQWRVSYV